MPIDHTPLTGLRMIAACAAAGKRTVQFWGLDHRNNLVSKYKNTDGPWSDWLGREAFGPNAPKQFTHVAAAQQGDFRVQLWALDHKQQLWSCTESIRRGEWDKWEGPNWNNSSALNFVCGCRQGGKQSAVLWALDQDYNLLTCHQEKFRDPWSPWVGCASPPNSQLFSLTAAQQNDGRIQFWALDTRLQLWSSYQTSAGGGWTGWYGPNWEGAPKLLKIVAAKQGGNRGAQIWGITRDYQPISNFQLTAGGNWNGWSMEGWNDPWRSHATHLAAAEDSHDAVHLWMMREHGDVMTKSQVAAGASWGEWEYFAWYKKPDVPPE